MVRWGAPALTLAALALIAWNCAFNPEIRFLTPGPGRWIVYPLPPGLVAYPGVELAGTFRRAFVLSEKPASALLSWRCLTNGELRVNGVVVPRPISSAKNWKTTLPLDIGPLLNQGTNQISVVVTNQLGPPALSLELKAGNFLLTSDETWEASVSGSNWRAAQLAAATARPGKGNELYLSETTGGALQRCSPLLCLFAAISVGGVALLQHYIRRPKMILIMLAAAWVLLFLHNFPFMPAAAGFDGPEHLNYVSYVQENHRLPSPQEGWEMFHPPLFYMMGAKLLDLFHRKVFEPTGLLLLRFLSLAIGTVNLSLVFIGLRLIFPGDWKKPLAGLVLAAFLPAQVYLLHYTTNETLSAMFVTGALCVDLHLLRTKRPWWGWYGVLGIVLGLALLSKASATLALPAILGALAVKLMLGRERSIRVWLGVIGAPLLICLLIGCWHYLTLWRHYYADAEAAGPWWQNKGLQTIVKRVIGFATNVSPWWQYKGLRTPGYYFSFGDSLTRPFFSGLHSFWDGFYTTLWGDSLWGGKVDFASRPPWNYDLMALGYVLALAPTALVLTGLIRALTLCFRAPSLIWLLLIGLGWLFAFALLGMSFVVPSYSQVKAFYGLPVLLPFCALGALGFDYWTGRGKVARTVLGVALGIWLINVYAAFWIRPNTVQSELSSAIAEMFYLKKDSAAAFLNVLNRHPDDSRVAIWLASSEAKIDPAQAVQRLMQTAKDDPANAQAEYFLACDLSYCNRWDEAVVHAKRAAELAPEDEAAWRTWCVLALRHKDYEDAVTAARGALSLNPTNLQIRSNLEEALQNLRQKPAAAPH